MRLPQQERISLDYIDSALVNSANPAAGQEVSFTIPGGYVYEPLWGFVQLVTNATVINRVFRLELVSEGVSARVAQSVNGLTASAMWDISLMRGVGSESFQATTADVTLPLPEMFLYPGMLLRTVTVNLQGTDDYGPLSLYCKRYYQRVLQPEPESDLSRIGIADLVLEGMR